LRRASLNLSLVSLVLLGACTSGATLEQDAQTIRKDIARAKDAGAIRCSPKELAMAESEVDFLEYEVGEGDWHRAERHAEVARENIQRALANTDPDQCGEKRVLIKETATPTITRKDSDGDGLFDDEDQCPLEPGPVGNKGCPLKDSDNDGVLDPDDKCPTEAGPATNQGCPIRDTDGDGLTDDIDQCPADPGPQTNQGCPIRDTDGDGVLDPDDGCPNDPGPASNKGCPLTDRDGDAVTDDIDQCPDVPGDPTLQGCPKKTLVVVREDRIEIRQQVHFATGKTKILKDSFELLSQVASVMRSNPQMKVRIEGHTDNVGSEMNNMKLSDGRAKAVREHLLSKEGIDGERLEAVGYGPSKPIASNSTAKGRALNRRVEFNIVAK
jgi:OOP family OmpA-OmpF porin